MEEQYFDEECTDPNRSAKDKLIDKLTYYQLIRDLEFKIELLKREIECLRSVLAEYEGDKSEYVQMHAANAFAEIWRHLK